MFNFRFKGINNEESSTSEINSIQNLKIKKRSNIDLYSTLTKPSIESNSNHSGDFASKLPNYLPPLRVLEKSKLKLIFS